MIIGDKIKNTYVPTKATEDWKQPLAEPEKQWRSGYPAMALPYCWEAAVLEISSEIITALNASGEPKLKNLTLLFAIPEYKISLSGRGRASQSDIIALTRNVKELVPLAAEGKVDDTSDLTVGEKMVHPSKGMQARVDSLLETLILPRKIPFTIRYQLLRRTASALLLAKEFYSSVAMTIVHTFNPTSKWFEDYQAFVGLFYQAAKKNPVVKLGVYPKNIAVCRLGHRQPRLPFGSFVRY